VTVVLAGTTTVVLFGGGGSDELKLKQPLRDSGRINASRKRRMMCFLNVELAETHALDMFGVRQASNAGMKTGFAIRPGFHRMRTTKLNYEQWALHIGQTDPARLAQGITAVEVDMLSFECAFRSAYAALARPCWTGPNATRCHWRHTDLHCPLSLLLDRPDFGRPACSVAILSRPTPTAVPVPSIPMSVQAEPSGGLLRL